MTPPARLRRVIQFFAPSGKRRKGRAHVPARPAYPPKPVEPPAVIDTTGEILSGIDWMEAERMVMDRLASDGLSALASFGDLYRATIRRSGDTPPRMPYGTVTGRVTVRSANPEMDRWVTRTPKMLVRVTDVQEVSPTTFKATGVPGLRLVLAPPSVPSETPVPVSRGSEMASRLVIAAGGHTAPSEIRADDMLVTSGWDEMFPAKDTHVCRGCMRVRSGTVHVNGMWECSDCKTVGRY